MSLSPELILPEDTLSYKYLAR
ncbi:MAG: hypothetical protein QOI77_2780, partial [Blastocatellia bacterium]|nr:hypothetical protein [Blastocatellia bacterium]